MKSIFKSLICAFSFSVSLFFCFSVVNAFSYQSPTFKIMGPVFSEGGGRASSENFAEQGIVAGPVAVGMSSSSKYIIKSGFEYFDETPPYTKYAVLNDGLGEDADEQFSLDSISANWRGIFDPESGLNKSRAYEIKLRRASDNFAWNPVTLSWQENAEFYATSTRITLENVDLAASEMYFFELRAINNLNMISLVVKSDGIKITPYLSFTIDSINVSLDELTPANNFTNQATTTLAVSTNAYRGYKIATRSVKPLTHNLFPTQQIPDWQGTNSEPAEWTSVCPSNPNYCGFGYKTSDTNLGEGNPARFAGNFFAGFNHDQNEIVSDHTDFVTGKTGEIQNEKTDIAYRISANGNEVPGNYTTNIIYVISVNY